MYWKTERLFQVPVPISVRADELLRINGRRERRMCGSGRGKRKQDEGKQAVEIQGTR